MKILHIFDSSTRSTAYVLLTVTVLRSIPLDNCGNCGTGLRSAVQKISDPRSPGSSADVSIQHTFLQILTVTTVFFWFGSYVKVPSAGNYSANYHHCIQPSQTQEKNNNLAHWVRPLEMWIPTYLPTFAFER